MARLENHRVRGDVELRLEELFNRADDRRHEVGTTPHGLRQDHIRPLGRGEPFDRVHQFVEVAAKARPGHFTDVEPLGAQRVRVDEVGGLIVGDDPDFQAPIHVAPREPAERGRLPGAEEAADHDEAYAMGHRRPR